jgi:N-acetyl-gamma-glutamyl-phosphate reductase
MVKIGIAGGSGYGGAELLHILIRHPEADISWISSQRSVGKPVSDVYPGLRGFLETDFSSLESLASSDLDVLFLALPHGEAMNLVSQLDRGLVVIDLSGDFRIADPELHEEYYKFPSIREQQKQFVYGLTEINRAEIRAAKRISNPGCFATATLLALYPLYQEDWIRGPVFVDTKTGSSGGGSSPTPGAHHPRRSNSLFPYKPFSHQHLPEILQILDTSEHPLVFQTYSAPYVRGIFASHYMKLNREPSGEEVHKLYQEYYSTEEFVRWVPDCPDVNFVRHSNFVDIGAASQDGFLIVWSVLDNLQKGAAGQAVQNMNLICGFAERTGLDLPPMHP